MSNFIDTSFVLRRRNRCIIGVLSLCVLITSNLSCSEKERAKIKHDFEMCLAVAAAIGVLLIVVAMVGASIQEERRNRARALQDAPREYNSNREQLQTALPDCSHILIEEGKKNKAYKTGSPSVQAREKCLRLNERALTNALLLRNHDINRGNYTAVEELQRINAACANCFELNKGKRNPVCKALSDGEVDVDLEFQSASNE